MTNLLLVYKDEYKLLAGSSWCTRMNIYYWLEDLGVYKDEYILLAGSSWCI